PPSSTPLRTRSYALARTFIGSFSRLSRNSSLGDVKGWCLAPTFPSSLTSNIGKSTTQQKLKVPSLTSLSLSRSTRRRPPSTPAALSSSSATKRSRSFGFASDFDITAATCWSVKNFADGPVGLPCSSILSDTSPFAPTPLQYVSSPSISLREKAPPPGAQRPRTTPPFAMVSENTLNSEVFTASETSKIFRPNRRSGLSVP